MVLVRTVILRRVAVAAWSSPKTDGEFAIMLAHGTRRVFWPANRCPLRRNTRWSIFRQSGYRFAV